MKASFLGGTISNISHLAPDMCAIRVSVAGEHDRHGVNQMGKLRRVLRGQSIRQDRAESLESGFQSVQTQHKSLIAGQAWKPVQPILFNQAIHLLFLEAALYMSEEPDGN